MTTTVYIMTRPIGLEYIASSLSKYFNTEVVAVEEKSTHYMKDLYMVQFANPIPEKTLERIWEYGEYRFWIEPTRMLRIYLSDPTEISSDHFISHKRYVTATDINYYKHLNHENSNCYMYDKLMHKYIPISENPFVF